MQLTKYLLIIIGSYLIGSISFSVIMSRLMGGDVRKKGSGNAGATNMARVFGMTAGLLTLLLDALKAVLCAWVGDMLLGDVGLSIAGAACLLGHCFPIYYGFKGGKGVSVGGALALMIDWRVFIAVMTVFFICVFATKKVSLGSVCATTSICLFGPIFAIALPKLLLGIFGTILIDFQHRGNIKRLINGTEPDFRPAKREKRSRLNRAE